MVIAPDQRPRTIAAVSRTRTPYPWEAVLEPGGLPEPIPEELHPAVREGLAAAGIDALWAHQADTFEAARRGHAIVTTGTASGKSLAFNLPVLDTLAGDVAARAFYLYPTKALAQDQARALGRVGGKYLRHAIYDGDTPREERRAIRQRSNLILTNPDMLHVGVLPNHRQWGDVLANLAWVVVDEELVDRDGAPRAERQIAMWNPPLVDERLGRRASALGEAAELLASLVEREIRTICFLKSRRGVELIQRFTRQKLEDAGRPDLAERIAPYRAGYTPMQRREIEQRLSEGDLLAVVATDALELGIDIGDLDA